MPFSGTLFARVVCLPLCPRFIWFRAPVTKTVQHLAPVRIFLTAVFGLLFATNRFQMTWYSKQKEQLASKKVLVVGAGGIGCELLKNLVLTGFKNIHVIDLDTIDVSNLNRQFLFRREHVGKSKAEVATAAVRALLPDTNISFDHGSIFDERFGLTFFQEYNFVMNALDNKAARTHVNRMCLAGRITLIESGSAGYLGQVTTIVRDQSECFECVPKPVQQKTFPGCTIRNTPSEHIHCTVWAKHLFNQLFGELDIDDDVSPDMNDEENKGSDEENNSAKSSEEEQIKNGEKSEPEPENTRTWAEKVNYEPTMVFNKLFNDDISYLLRMKNLWKERRPPTPFTLEALEDSGSSSSSVADDDIQKVWSAAQCGRVFCDSVIALRDRKASLTEGQILSWDKDDDEAMRFVAACANIRAKIFGIPMKTAFEIKSMAGNIIPAIATTNAMVAGMMVVEALKVAAGKMDKLRNVFINRHQNPRGKILMDEVPPKPNPKCFVCSDRRECFVKVNLHEMTIKGLQDKVLKGALNMVAPDVTESSSCRVIISSDGDTVDIEGKRLSELSIADGCLLECDDFVQRLELKLIVQSSDKLKGEDFEILQDSGANEEPAEAMETEEEASRKRKLDEVIDPEPKRSRAEEVCA